VPDIPQGLAAAELQGRVRDLAPSILSYVISFLVIGTFWVAHHRNFRYIKRYDGRLLWLNLLFLLGIAFLPFPTALLGRYGNTQFAVVFYATVLVVTGLLLVGLWLYATAGHRLVDPDLDPRFIRYNTVRGVSASAIFLLSIGLSFIGPQVAEYSWLLVALARPVLRRLYGFDA